MAQLTNFQEELIKQSNTAINQYASTMEKSLSTLLDDTKLQALHDIVSSIATMWIVALIVLLLCLATLGAMLIITYRLHRHYRLAHIELVKMMMKAEYTEIESAAQKYHSIIETHQEVILEQLLRCEENTDAINISFSKLQESSKEMQKSLQASRENEKQLYRQLITEKQKNTKNKTNSHSNENSLEKNKRI